MAPARPVGTRACGQNDAGREVLLLGRPQRRGPLRRRGQSTTTTTSGVVGAMTDDRKRKQWSSSRGWWHGCSPSLAAHKRVTHARAACSVLTAPLLLSGWADSDFQIRSRLWPEAAAPVGAGPLARIQWRSFHFHWVSELRIKDSTARRSPDGEFRINCSWLCNDVSSLLTLFSISDHVLFTWPRFALSCLKHWEYTCNQIEMVFLVCYDPLFFFARRSMSYIKSTNKVINIGRICINLIKF